MRIALISIAVALAACEPAPGAFRPKPVGGGAPCMTLPRLGPRPADARLPIVHLDLNLDRQEDYIVPKLETCDELGNCDHDVYWVRESCAIFVGTVRGKEVLDDQGLTTNEAFTYEGELGARETRWTIGPPDYRYHEAAPPRCRLAKTHPESHRCDGQPDEEEQPVEAGGPEAGEPPAADGNEPAPDAKSLIDQQPGGDEP